MTTSLTPFLEKHQHPRKLRQSLNRVARQAKDLAKAGDVTGEVDKEAVRLRSTAVGKTVERRVHLLVAAKPDVKCAVDNFGDASDVADELTRELCCRSVYGKAQTKRMEHCIRTLASNPGASFPQAFGDDGAGLKGFYRFLGSKHVTLDETLEPHILGTVSKVASAGLALAIHDSTEFIFPGEAAREGLGYMRGDNQGFHGHLCLAVSADGKRTPLGVLAFHAWTRSKPTGEKRSDLERYQDPHKEFSRWKNSVKMANQRAGRSNLIHVTDREADDYDLMFYMSDFGRYVIRMRQDRLIFRQETLPADARKVSHVFQGVTGICQREVPLSPRSPRRNAVHRKLYPPRSYRMATLNFAAQTVEIRRPDNAPKSIPEYLKVNVVRVWEVGQPEGEPAVEWFLFTSEPVDTVDQVLAVVDYYRARWVIEEYFKALKTGCAFESRQLETYEHLRNALGLLMPIAVELLRLRNLARDDPKAPGNAVLPDIQLNVLRATCRRLLPEDPTAEEVQLAVAALGGHIRSNGAPGWQVLWRGYKVLQERTAGWIAARNGMRSDDGRLGRPADLVDKK